MELREIVRRFDVLFLKRRILFQKALTDEGLYFGQLPIVEYIARHNGCSQVEIAETLNLSPASVAISTKRLQKAGIIDKSVDDTNLRSKKLTITEKGRGISNKCREMVDSLDKRLFASFTGQELAQLKEYLDRLIDNMSDEQNKFSINSFLDMVALENQLGKNVYDSKEGEDE